MDKKLAWVFTQSDEKTGTFAGGVPYLESMQDWPKTDDGTQPLRFLFQIDLDKIDEDLGLNLPKNGYLQFFTNPDDLFGTMLTDRDDRYSGGTTLVRHVTDVKNLRARSMPKDFKDNDDETPLTDHANRVYFNGSLVESIANNDGVSGRLSDNDSENPWGNEYGHPIVDDLTDYEFYLGGHPVFTQEDFRGNNDNLTLLLGSNSGQYVNWGDMGSAGFWLPNKAVANQDYSKVFPYWDCY